MYNLAVILASLSVVLGAPQTRSISTLDGRIVGGEDADIGDYNYQLSLLFLGSHICGAVTIAPTWALTAAHCTDGYSSIFLSVRAASSLRDIGGVVVAVAQIIEHSQYSILGVDYDIAALRLSSALESGNSAPLPLSSSVLKPPAGSPATITGWGATAEGGSYASVLQVIVVPIVSQANCQASYGDFITDRMFCAGLLGVGGKDACQQDSGGPVVVDGELVGLVSWGNGCARPSYPGVYASVPAYREWILENTGV